MNSTHVVIVAVENYVVGGLAKVLCARADAEAFRDVLVANGVPPDQITTLIDSDASADNVRYHLFSVIGGLTNNDRFVFFYAGHGTRTEVDGQENYLTTYGCRDDYLLQPAIKIKDLVDRIDGSKCKNSCLFIDACHSELSANSSIRSPLSKFSTEALINETSDSEYLVCFSACSKNQKSHSSKALGHGIWSYYLIQALKGDVPQVIEERSINSSKLQDYLQDVVPKHVRKEYGSNTRQTPRMSGSATSSFEVLILPPLSQAEDVDPLSFHLFGCEEAELRDLSGWEKSYKNWGNEAFLSSSAGEEMEEHKNKIYEQLRSALSLKNSEISVSDTGQGFIIETPECSVSAWIRYSSTHDQRYVIEFEISEVSDICTLDKIDFPPLSELITGACELLSNLDLKATINALESADFSIKTDAKNTFFKTEYQDPDFVVKGNEERLVLVNDSGLSLREIAETSADILSQIKPHLKFKEPKRFPRS